MKKGIFLYLCLIPFLHGFSQNPWLPSPEKAVKYNIVKAIDYSTSNLFDSSEIDTTTYTFDSKGHVVFEDDPGLGISENRYTYNYDGSPIQCIQYNGKGYEMDSIYYEYYPDNTYTIYKYSSNDFMGPGESTLDQKEYNTQGLLIKEVDPVVPINNRSDTIFRSWKYDVKGNLIRENEWYSRIGSTSIETRYTLKFDVNGRVIKTTWPSKYSTIELNTETYKYNKLGLIVEYGSRERGKSKVYTRHETFVYKYGVD